MRDAKHGFEVGQRYYIGTDIGTIRFVGYLHDMWLDELALGIEWDSPERGSNSGSLNGKFYFTVRVPQSGSFIKAKNKSLRRERLYFTKSILARYADATQFTASLSFGSKLVEGVGFDKLNRTNSELANLRSIFLERQGIFECCEDDEDHSNIFSRLNNVVHLDLSFNLFSSLHSVWQIVDHLPNLDSLILDGNRFDESTLRCTDVHPLRVLKIDNVALSVPSINKVLKKFPRLHELLLAGNYLNDEDMASLVIPLSVRVLSLPYNQLKKIPLLGSLQLTELNLSHNHICSLPQGVLQSIELLDLRDNAIDDMGLLDLISIMYPNLRALRINRNPLFDKMLSEDMTVNLVGFLPCKANRNAKQVCGIESINGGTFHGDEVQNYELYFISQVSKGLWTRPRPSRWNFLLTKHGKSEVSLISPQHNQGMRAKIVTLKLNVGDIVHTRLLMNDNTILRLRGIFSKLLGNVSVLDIALYYYIDDLVVDGNGNRLYLDDNMARLSNYGFQPEHNIYCKVLNE